MTSIFQVMKLFDVQCVAYTEVELSELGKGVTVVL